MQKYIDVQYGQEFAVHSDGKITENSFFYSSYLQAFECISEISTLGKSLSKNDNLQNFASNIIAFCGERGQGKTTAMLSFSDAMKDCNKKANINCISEKISKLGMDFYVLDIIDPTQLERNENILTIIVSRIFLEFKLYWEKYENNHSTVSIAKKNEMLSLFHKCYSHIETIKQNAKQIEPSYEDSLMELSRLGDSANLKNDLFELINAFFVMIGHNGFNPMLVLQIDDTDLNIQRAYEIIEDIRKYFSIPNVIILMATKIEQLRDAVEQQFRNDYSTLLEYERIKAYDPQHMASKYINKLIPENRKIYLPEIVAIADSSEEQVCLRYWKNGENLFNNEDDFQESIFLFIYQKVGIRFAKPSEGVHSIIPNSMRELINFLSFLSRLDDFKPFGFFRFGIEEKQKIIEKNLYNLERFEEYLIKNWVPSNVDEGYITFIHNVLNTPNYKKHQRVITDIYDILMESDIFSIVNYNKKNNVFYNGEIIEIYKTNPLSYSVGDVFDALVKLENIFPVDSIFNFTFAIKTIYTITMYKLFYRIEPKNKITALDEFIGGDLFGFENTNKFFPSKGGRSRGKFEVNIKQIASQDLSLDSIKSRLEHFFFEGYSNDDLIYREEKSTNSLPFSVLYFWVSIRFVHRANFRYDDGGDYCRYILFLNMEFIGKVIEKQLAMPDKRKGHATMVSFLTQFYSNVKELLPNFAPNHDDVAIWFDSIIDKGESFGLLDRLIDIKDYSFNVNDYAKNYRATATLSNAIDNFIKDFVDFARDGEMIYDVGLELSLHRLLDEINDSKWDSSYNNKARQLMVKLYDSLQPKDILDTEIDIG